VSYGRIGRRERSVTYSAADDAAAIVRHCLHRRAKRIGVPYQIRELCDPKGWAWRKAVNVGRLVY